MSERKSIESMAMELVSRNEVIERLREQVSRMESALKNIAETSSSTRIRRLAKEALGGGA